MKKSFSLFRYDLNVQVVRSSTGPHSTKSGPHLVPILLTVQVSQLSRMNLLKCNPETIKCDESNLIIICIRYLMPDCSLNSLGGESHKIRHRSNYTSATHSHPWRAKKMDTTSVSNSRIISFYEESNCICLPQVTREIEWDRQTRRSWQCWNVSRGETRKKAKWELRILSTPTLLVSWQRKEGPECACLVWPSNFCSV